MTQPALGWRVGAGMAAGMTIAYVDNVAYAGEVSPIVIVVLLLTAGTAATGFWGRRGWIAAATAWLCVPLAHLIKHILGVPDTLHPDTYGSILMLAGFTFAVTALGTGAGIMLSRRGSRHSP